MRLIGITIGDQAGIGIEIISKAVIELHDLCDFKIIGQQVEYPVYGKVNSEYGRLAGDAIKEAVRLAQCGEIDAIVTAPISKEALNLGGYRYSGHTEMLGDLCGIPKPRMMLVYNKLRVVHATTHCSLREALDGLTTSLLLQTVFSADSACKRLGVAQPRLGICALNPHASDGGLFGDEEKRIIQPAINEALWGGINVYSQPIPADIAFAKALGGAFDCVIAMYHDQGHIPIKTLGFHWNNELNEWDKVDGVNVTLGLPIIRTSPDHGVAFGKAGKGTADPTSMISAIKLAVKMVESRKKDAV